MKIVYISDTHGLHDRLDTMNGDMIIHAGDICNRGTQNEAEQFLDWFKGLDFKHKIFVAGNHDYFFEKATKEEVNKLIPKGIHYLNDSGVTIDRINIWGSPVQPWFYDWAFNRQRGAAIKMHWDLIPDNTDILITHGPPFNILDKTTSGEKVGCEDLLHAVKCVKPKIHVFGHIHEAYGIENEEGTKYINASVLDVRYNCVNKPVELEY